MQQFRAMVPNDELKAKFDEVCALVDAPTKMSAREGGVHVSASEAGNAIVAHLLKTGAALKMEAVALWGKIIAFILGNWAEILKIISGGANLQEILLWVDTVFQQFVPAPPAKVTKQA